MSFNQQYFADAKKVIMGVLLAERPELLKFFGKVDYENKHDRSIVTHLDKDIELKLKNALRKFDQNVGFWGEELGREGNQKDYWLIDPIDGTEAFVRGIPSPRNILTFVSDNEPKFTLVYRFVSDQLLLALENKGATKNGAKLQVSDRPLNRSWIDFWVNMLEPVGYEIFRKIRPKVAGIAIRRDSFEIAEGFMEGLIVNNNRGGDIWDYAPRAMLIKEAGGRVANIGSDKYVIHKKNFIATNAVIFDELHKILSGLA